MFDYILEGTWDEVSKKAAKLKGVTHVRLEVVAPQRKGKMIQWGMFRSLGDITEAHFKDAEWRGPVDGQEYSPPHLVPHLEQPHRGSGQADIAG